MIYLMISLICLFCLFFLFFFVLGHQIGWSARGRLHRECQTKYPIIRQDQIENIINKYEGHPYAQTQLMAAEILRLIKKCLNI